MIADRSRHISFMLSVLVICCCLLLQWLGKIAFVTIPLFAVLTVLVGAFAAKTYNASPDVYLIP